MGLCAQTFFLDFICHSCIISVCPSVVLLYLEALGLCFGLQDVLALQLALAALVVLCLVGQLLGVLLLQLGEPQRLRGHQVLVLQLLRAAVVPLAHLLRRVLVRLHHVELLHRVSRTRHNQDEHDPT